MGLREVGDRVELSVTLVLVITEDSVGEIVGAEVCDFVGIVGEVGGGFVGHKPQVYGHEYLTGVAQ